MKDLDIIKMWKEGYSKSYIVNEKLKDLKELEKYRGIKRNLLREEAYKYVEDVLLKEYRYMLQCNRSKDK